MNRQIKFRGKRIDNGEWVYGDLHTHDCTEIIVHDGYRAESYYPVATETVGQFTGLNDKNGNEIYEGDILHVKVNYPKEIKEYDGIVEYDDLNPCFVINKIKGDSYDIKEYDFIKCNLTTLTIIGNRFDNPELLKGGER